jgi:exodeoxyribonuclease VII large subunit
VGHETDWTIADFVADLRAPTPSAAAELAVPEKQAVADLLAEIQDSMLQTLRDKLEGLERRLTYAAAHPFLQDPRRLWEQRAQHVDELAARLPDALRLAVERLEMRLRVSAGKLDAISPLKVLGRGYAIAENKGKILYRASQVKEGDVVRVRLSEGEINCEVTS